ncbi:MAG: macrolide transporter subunit MacA [Terrimicrobiaceae bacterium]
MKKLIAIILLLAAISYGAHLADWFPGGKPGRDVEEDPTAEVELRDIEHRLLLTGEVVPAFQVQIKSEVGGKVKEIRVRPGDSVKKGDILAVIDDTDILTDKAAAQTEIEGAQLSVEKNRGNYLRAKALFEEKLISKEVYDNLRADYALSENSLEKARARMQTVEDRLSKTLIVAPADGTVLDVQVNVGQVVVAAASVNAGTVLMEFADLSTLLINSHVNQVDAPLLKPGQSLEVSISGADSATVPAQIEFLAPLATIKNNIKGFQLEALILENDGRLKPGMSVTMQVPVAKAPGAVTVPVSAIFRHDKQTFVYVRKGGVTEQRKVEVGISDLGYAEIRSGLSEGEEILLFEPKTVTKKS